MDDLVRVVEMLKIALKTAEDLKAADILIYLIGMAVIEGEYQVAKKRSRS
ncbi:hypothetical protein JNB71_03390 [Rhizobium herbae]|uniref:Uncharacterized protein n=1 Tax=Rhizobium herbae TaxID=508661 RepID=A0ABS7H6G7_9HYPH|nr:hypothetical protein [Rhizobium herbae]MBW9062355.1 hypothetical protein [Rhizobium herbae]